MTFGKVRQQILKFNLKHSGVLMDILNAKHLKKSYNERTDNNRLSMIDAPFGD